MAKKKDEAENPRAITGDNSIDATTKAAVVSFVERYERLEEEKATIVEDQKELMAEAKGVGYEPKVIKEIIRRRKKDQDELDEFEAKVALYQSCFN